MGLCGVHTLGCTGCDFGGAQGKNVGLCGVQTLGCTGCKFWGAQGANFGVHGVKMWGHIWGANSGAHRVQMWGYVGCKCWGARGKNVGVRGVQTLGQTPAPLGIHWCHWESSSPTGTLLVAGHGTPTRAEGTRPGWAEPPAVTTAGSLQRGDPELGTPGLDRGDSTLCHGPG